jgi:hypothetical protein
MPLLFVAKQPNGLYALYDAERSDVTETNLSRAEVERAKLHTGDADRETRNYNYLGIGDGDPPTMTRWEAILRMMRGRDAARAEHLTLCGEAAVPGAHPPFAPLRMMSDGEARQELETLRRAVLAIYARVEDYSTPSHPLKYEARDILESVLWKWSLSDKG